MMNLAAQDAANVVRRLREFYRQRRETEVFEPIDVKRLVEQAIALTQRKWKDQAQGSGVSIELRTELQDVPVLPATNLTCAKC